MHTKYFVLNIRVTQKQQRCQFCCLNRVSMVLDSASCFQLLFVILKTTYWWPWISSVANPWGSGGNRTKYSAQFPPTPPAALGVKYSSVWHSWLQYHKTVVDSSEAQPTYGLIRDFILECTCRRYFFFSVKQVQDNFQN